MYANHRHYTLFTIALLTFIVTVGGYFYIRYRVYHQAIRSSELTREAKALEDKSKHALDITKTSTKLADEQTLVNSYIVPKDKIVDFLEAVEKIGTNTGTKLELTGINTTEIVKGKKIEDNFTSMKARVDIVGTWPNVMRAFSLIENMPYSLSLSTIRLAEGSNSSDALVAESVQDSSSTSTPVVKKVAATKLKLWSLAFDIRVLILDRI